ncbi:MAG TPA: hypothetical protein VGC30_13855 [Dokdonella sp.]
MAAEAADHRRRGGDAGDGRARSIRRDVPANSAAPSASQPSAPSGTMRAPVAATAVAVAAHRERASSHAKRSIGLQQAHALRRDRRRDAPAAAFRR